MAEKKVIQTPDYWTEEQYQPLVESVTVYGHKVEIPARWLDSLDWMEKLSQQEKVEYLKHGLENWDRSYRAKDFLKVLLEIYQPQE